MSPPAGRMRSHTAPFVSVVIPVLNGKRTIRDCLVSLLRMEYPQEGREILVVDNGSTDGTEEIVRRFPVRYLWEGRRGLSYARNRGIEASKGEIVASLDADCVATTGWLRELVRGFDRDEVGVVVGEVVAYPPRTPAERYTAVRKPLWQTRSISYPGSPWFNLGNAAVSRKVFDRIGLLDPRFAGTACEDIDFGWRFFRDRGFGLSHCPKAVVFHRHRMTAGQLFKQYRGYGHGQAILWHKYPKELRWDWRLELKAHGDLLLTAWDFSRAAVRSKMRGGETAECSYFYLELVRKLGERIGFINGTFRRAPGFG